MEMRWTYSEGIGEERGGGDSDQDELKDKNR